MAAIAASTPRARANAVAASNHGIITLEHARRAGLSRRQIDGLLASGQWERMHPGTYRITAVPPTWRTRVMAAVRAAERGPRKGGRTAAASHHTAAALLGVRAANSGLPEISVAGSCLPTLRGVKTHRTATLEECDVQMVEGIPTTTGARMLVDQSMVLPDERYLSLVDDTICERAANRARTHARAVDLRPGRPRVSRLIELTGPDAEAEFHSWLERTGSGLVDAAGLPQPQWNVAVFDDHGRIGIVDALWEGVPVIMELEGMRFHTTPRQRQRDAERFNRLTEIARVRRFTYRDVVERPGYVIASLREALTAGPRKK